jgi:hypothetical protein
MNHSFSTTPALTSDKTDMLLPDSMFDVRRSMFDVFFRQRYFPFAGIAFNSARIRS